MFRMLISTLIAAGALAAGCSAPPAGNPVAGGPAPASSGASEPARPTTTRAPDPARCNDQQNYAGDTRSNAEINSIGEDTGTCPPPRPVEPGIRCTNQINYAGDSRANAEINSIGEVSGFCPLPLG